MSGGKNVLGKDLEVCCMSPKTGFYRNGKCDTGPGDFGIHTVCVQATAEFLKFSKERGNDLSTPVPDWAFPGLKPGDCWCLCASRWRGRPSSPRGVRPRSAGPLGRPRLASRASPAWRVAGPGWRWRRCPWGRGRRISPRRSRPSGRGDSPWRGQPRLRIREGAYVERK